MKGWRRWAFPLLVIGANSIAIYVMSWTIEHFISRRSCATSARRRFAILGPPFEPVLRGVAVLLVFWSILYWMYRRKIFRRHLTGSAVGDRLGVGATQCCALTD